MKCLLVDDEKLALDLLEDNVSKIPFLQIAGKCRNAMEALEKLRKEPIDLIFLDIQMPGLTGIQLLESLSVKPMVIFLTAYENFAIQGFNLDAVDYLLKPVSFERFLKAANKAYDLYQLKHGEKIKNEISPVNNFIFVNSEYNLVKILFEDILYIEGLKDYVKIYTSKSEKPILTRLNLKGIEEKLDSNQFLRVQKSFIVAIHKVDSIRKNRLRIGKVEIPFSDNYSENISKILGTNNIQ